LKILIDMNLAPAWCDTLGQAGHEAIHWSEVGEASATDETLLAWAREREYIILTHDLDFTALLAATNAEAPSIVQIRGGDVLSESLGSIVVRSLVEFESQLSEGAIVTLEPARARVRLLPLSRRSQEP
jgi:predicted nuclease of predicted toxin-antitoxin system